MGIPLHRIKDIRMLYGETPWGDTTINFEAPDCVPSPRGHVIAARITSENPDEVCILNSTGLAGHILNKRWHGFCRLTTGPFSLLVTRRASSPARARCRSSISAAVKTCGATSVWGLLGVCMSLLTPSLATVSPGGRTERRPFREFFLTLLCRRLSVLPMMVLSTPSPYFLATPGDQRGLDRWKQQFHPANQKAR